MFNSRSLFEIRGAHTYITVCKSIHSRAYVIPQIRFLSEIVESGHILLLARIVHGDASTSN